MMVSKPQRGRDDHPQGGELPSPDKPAGRPVDPDNQTSAQTSGSPDRGGPVFLAVGQLRRPHGIRGEIILHVLTDFPERLKRGVTVYVGEDHRPLRIRSSREHGAALLLSFYGYDSPETVRELTNSMLFVSSADRPALPEGEYYHHELLGMRVLTDDGGELGTLTQILETGANDVYIVARPSGGDVLLPAIDSVILDIDVERGEMRVHLLEGLLPD
ncbi:MAG: ribosome maturation factor RimM [Chloroflexi bacterium]|jgi:16S rRNA processing protein RimM|nr:ribosome maturation factor RimM [Chloroflexota bacterium]